MQCPVNGVNSRLMESHPPVSMSAVRHLRSVVRGRASLSAPSAADRLAERALGDRLAGADQLAGVVDPTERVPQEHAAGSPLLVDVVDDSRLVDVAQLDHRLEPRVELA